MRLYELWRRHALLVVLGGMAVLIILTPVFVRLSRHVITVAGVYYNFKGDPAEVDFWCYFEGSRETIAALREGQVEVDPGTSRPVARIVKLGSVRPAMDAFPFGVAHRTDTWRRPGQLSLMGSIAPFAPLYRGRPLTGGTTVQFRSQAGVVPCKAGERQALERQLLVPVSAVVELNLSWEVARNLAVGQQDLDESGHILARLEKLSFVDRPAAIAILKLKPMAGRPGTWVLEQSLSGDRVVHAGIRLAVYERNGECLYREQPVRVNRSVTMRLGMTEVSGRVIELRSPGRDTTSPVCQGVDSADSHPY